MRHPEGQAREAEESLRVETRQACMTTEPSKATGGLLPLTPPHTWSHTAFFFLLWTKADGLCVSIDLLLTIITCALLRTPAHTDITPLPPPLTHCTPLPPSFRRRPFPPRSHSHTQHLQPAAREANEPMLTCHSLRSVGLLIAP